MKRKMLWATLAMAVGVLSCACPAFSQGALLFRSDGSQLFIVGDMPDSPMHYWLAMISLGQGDFARANPDGSWSVHLGASKCTVLYLQWVGPGYEIDPTNYAVIAAGLGNLSMSGEIVPLDSASPLTGPWYVAHDLVGSCQADLQGEVSSLDWHIVYHNDTLLYWRATVQ